MAVMRRIEIDFAPPTLARTLRRTPAWTWGLGAAGLALCLTAALGWVRVGKDHTEIEHEIAAADAKLAARAARTVVKPVLPVPAEQVLAVNAIVARLNLPWGALLDALDDAGTPTVALLELTPDPKNRRFKGMAEARTSAAMIGYLERLKRQPIFDAVTLTRHEFAELDDSQVVRFEFEVRWLEGGA
jgi:hypothetical protein